MSYIRAIPGQPKAPDSSFVFAVGYTDNFTRETQVYTELPANTQAPMPAQGPRVVNKPPTGNPFVRAISDLAT